MKWIYRLAIVVSILGIITANDWMVRCWASSCLLWILIASGNNNGNNRNDRNQHSINY